VGALAARSAAKRLRVGRLHGVGGGKSIDMARRLPPNIMATIGMTIATITWPIAMTGAMTGATTGVATGAIGIGTGTIAGNATGSNGTHQTAAREAHVRPRCFRTWSAA